MLMMTNNGDKKINFGNPPKVESPARDRTKMLMVIVFSNLFAPPGKLIHQTFSRIPLTFLGLFASWLMSICSELAKSPPINFEIRSLWSLDQVFSFLKN